MNYYWLQIEYSIGCTNFIEFILWCMDYEWNWGVEGGMSWVWTMLISMENLIVFKFMLNLIACCRTLSMCMIDDNENDAIWFYKVLGFSSINVCKYMYTCVWECLLRRLWSELGVGGMKEIEITQTCKYKLCRHMYVQGYMSKWY